MSWRADSQALQAEKENEKNFLKIAKKLRDIRRIENQAHIEENQKSKIEQKGALLEEISQIQVGQDIWKANDDVLDLIEIEFKIIS